MRQQVPSRRIIHFISDSRRAPRQGHQISLNDGTVVGEVVSGTFSPALGLGVGIGFIKKEFTGTVKDIIFGEEKLRLGAQTAARPFYKTGSLKN